MKEQQAAPPAFGCPDLRRAECEDFNICPPSHCASLCGGGVDMRPCVEPSGVEPRVDFFLKFSKLLKGGSQSGKSHVSPEVSSVKKKPKISR